MKVLKQSYVRTKASLKQRAAAVMSLRSKFLPFWSQAPHDPVVRDADELIATMGEAAFDTAALMSWREDNGFMETAEPGHWWRVKCEIGRRVGLQQSEPAASFPASRRIMFSPAAATAAHSV